MASIGITASIHRACTSQHITNKPPSQPKPPPTKPITPNLHHLKLHEKPDKSQFLASGNIRENSDQHPPHSGFSDERWKNGTWDLNMFVKHGKMDWDSVIVAEAKRRKYAQLHPEASSNEEPVVFRSSVIPAWAWILHSHLPEAELLNGGAAMVGFFMAYLVDALTGLGVVGQTGNFIGKLALLFTVIGVVLFRRKEDIQNLKKIADEATYYDKQWRNPE